MVTYPKTGFMRRSSPPSKKVKLPQRNTIQSPEIGCWRGAGFIYRKVNKGGPRRERTCLRRCTNNKGADHPAHPRSLISSFIIRSSESIISMLTTSKFSIFQLVTVSVQTDFSLTLSETPKTGFSHDEAQVYVSLFILFFQCSLIFFI